MSIGNDVAKALSSTAAGYGVIMSEIAFANVLDFNGKGDKINNDTKAFNDAINSLPNGGVVIAPPGRTYMIDGVGFNQYPDYPTAGVVLKDNITLILYGATLQAIPNNSKQYCILNISNCKNVAVLGGTLIGERDKHVNSSEYSTIQDQFGCGVMIAAADNVLLDSVYTTNFMGDGFSIGGNINGVASTNITMRKCTSYANRRNGLSVFHCVGGTISDCSFINTSGCSPESGIDLEPNPGRVVTDMILENNRCIGNNQHGILLAEILAGNGSAKNCEFKGNRCWNNGLSGFYLNHADENTFIGNTSRNNGNNGFMISASNWNIFKANISKQNKFHGYAMGDSNNNTLLGNQALENAKQGVTWLYDNYNFWNIQDCDIQANKAKTDGTYTRYGMYIDAASKNNLVTNNDLKGSSTTSYGFNNASTTTIKGAGNRLKDGTFGTADYN